MTVDHYIGWDIGGANLKVARLAVDGTILDAAQYATPLWRGLGLLHECVQRSCTSMAAQTMRHALTMTGELVDLFPDRDTGVRALLDAFVRHVPEPMVRVFAGAAGFLPVADAHGQPGAVASANWLATARCVAGHVRDGILVDVGSTTTDIVPIRDHAPCNRGWNDRERMQLDELLYTGVVRTPVMALVQRVPVAGRWQNVAAECFATTADVYRITGELEASADLHDTADGRGKTAAESRVRLARMVGGDARAGDRDPWTALARHVSDRQLALLQRAFSSVRAAHGGVDPVTVVGTGAGAFLARRLAASLDCPYLEFPRLFPAAGPSFHAVNTCAPAVAVADLVRRGFGP